MPTFEAVKVATVPATPVVLDAAASVAPAGQARGEGERVAGLTPDRDIARVHQG
jgi:hypothetical protein